MEVDDDKGAWVVGGGSNCSGESEHEEQGECWCGHGDRSACLSCLEPQVEPMQTEQVLPEGLPQENLDKASTEPREEPNAATSSTTLVEHPVYFVSTVLRDARECYQIGRAHV